jgi:hypothetical protein
VTVSGKLSATPVVSFQVDVYDVTDVSGQDPQRPINEDIVKAAAGQALAEEGTFVKTMDFKALG